MVLSFRVGLNDQVLGYKYECRGNEDGEEVGEIHSGTAKASAIGFFGFGSCVSFAVIIAAIIPFAALRRLVLFGGEVGILQAANGTFSVGAVIMIQLFCLVSGIRVAASGTGIGGKSSVFTSRIGNYGLVVVLSLNLAVGIGITAVSTGMSGITILCTGGRSYNGLVVMSYSFCLVSGVRIATSGAGIGGKSTVLASGSGNYGFVVVLTLYLAVGIGITAVSTGVGGITVIRAGGRSYSRTVVVTYCLGLVGLVAVATGTGVLCVASCGAGGCYGACFIAVGMGCKRICTV